MSLIGLLIFIVVAILIFWLIFHYLLPLLPAPWRTVVTVIIIVIIIIVLLNWLGVFSGDIRIR
jgi:hypothetical protein